MPTAVSTSVQKNVSKTSTIDSTDTSVVDVSEDVLTAKLPPSAAEELLLGKIRRVALENGWLFYHTHRSTRSDPGYCDCTIAKPGHPLYVWELKTATGKLTQAQAVWLDFLRQVTGVEAACYRPADWATMVAKLTEKTA